MKVLIAYDSFFGNTEKIAQAIGSALGSPQDVATLRVNTVTPEQLTGLELLIVGSPTRGFRPSEATLKFLKSIAPAALKGVRVAAFDTRIATSDIKSPILRFFINFAGYAAKPIAEQLKKKGGDLVVEPEGFYVKASEGPLKDGELERAADWARRVGEARNTVS